MMREGFLQLLVLTFFFFITWEGFLQLLILIFNGLKLYVHHFLEKKKKKYVHHLYAIFLEKFFRMLHFKTFSFSAPLFLEARAHLLPIQLFYTHLLLMNYH